MMRLSARVLSDWFDRQAGPVRWLVMAVAVAVIGCGRTNEPAPVIPAVQSSESPESLLAEANRLMDPTDLIDDEYCVGLIRRADSAFVENQAKIVAAVIGTCGRLFAKGVRTTPWLVLRHASIAGEDAKGRVETYSPSIVDFLAAYESAREAGDEHFPAFMKGEERLFAIAKDAGSVPSVPR